MTAQKKDISASVRQKLLNKARESSRPFNELLQHFAIERFIYRLSRTPHAKRFFLKGALMLRAWGGPGTRPTMDIDLLGQANNSPEKIAAIVADVCDVDVADDGMRFNTESIQVTKITEDAEYEGIRVKLICFLGKAQAALQIEIGFGDIVKPAFQKVTYPTLLDFPAPQLSGYSMDSSIAEKFQAMVKLGVINSRMKDFYDIWLLSHRFDFDGETLASAIKATFENRQTELGDVETLFQHELKSHPGKSRQWQGFIKKARLEDCPAAFEEVLDDLSTFLVPPAKALEETSFKALWQAPGPWKY